MKDEMIVCYKREDIERTGILNKKFTPMPNVAEISNFFETLMPLSLNRKDVEHDESFLQVIPYPFFQCDGKIFVARRTAETSEKRLHNKYTIGFGGHPNFLDDDIKFTMTDMLVNADRELKEEMFVPLHYKLNPLGFLYNNENAVGRVHFGVVIAVNILDENSIALKEDCHKEGVWVKKEDLYSYAPKDAYEGWTNIIIEDCLGVH